MDKESIIFQEVLEVRMILTVRSKAQIKKVYPQTEVAQGVATFMNVYIFT